MKNCGYLLDLKSQRILNKILVIPICYTNWSVIAGSTISNGREPKSCLGRVFNSKLGCIATLLSKCMACMQTLIELKTRPRVCPELLKEICWTQLYDGDNRGWMWALVLKIMSHSSIFLPIKNAHPLPHLIKPFHQF